MLSGLNHITIAVSDLSKSFDFYVSVLGLVPKVRWATGAYLALGDLWVCLSLGKVSPSKDYSHISFSIAEGDFDTFSARLLSLRLPIWKQNLSEGDSLYILDPDGHKLEIHVGSLQSRLEKLKSIPYENLEWF